LELYSVRDAMRRDPERTMTAVRAMGYTDVELLWSFGNFGRTPQQVRDALTNSGLRATSAHHSRRVSRDGPALRHRAAHRARGTRRPQLHQDTSSLDD
jgi:sugar phosphate isomerase/epimerase